MSEAWTRLISGSDLRGVAIASPDKPITLTDEAARAAAYQYTRWCAAQAGKAPSELRIAVGNDSRLSGDRIRHAVFAGISAAGARILDCGLCTTPAMFMVTIDGDMDCISSIMITASHLPYDRNGLKFMTRAGGLSSSEVKSLVAAMQAEPVPEAAVPRIERIDYLARYAQGLRERLCAATGKAQPLAGMRIVVDAGNGAGGFFADRVLAPLGADTTGSQYLEPDGHFPHHAPNPEDHAAMQALSRAVLDAKADLGILFDADCDRAAIADASGREINRNRLVALASVIALGDCPGGTIVTDSITSSGLAAFIARHGGTHLRFKRGYKNVIEESQRLNREGIASPLAIETSGHAAFRENHFLDDGAYLIVRLLEKAAAMHAEGGALSDLIADLKEPVEEAEVRLTIEREDFRPYGLAAIEKLEAAARDCDWATIAPDNHEGVRISFALDGVADAAWLLLRLSVHDPVLPLNFESDVPGGCQRIAAFALSALEGAEGIALDALRKAV